MGTTCPGNQRDSTKAWVNKYHPTPPAIAIVRTNQKEVAASSRKASDDAPIFRVRRQPRSCVSFEGVMMLASTKSKPRVTSPYIAHIATVSVPVGAQSRFTAAYLVRPCDGKRFPESTSGSALPSRRTCTQMKNPVAH